MKKKKISIFQKSINFGVCTWNSHTPKIFGFLVHWCWKNCTQFYMQEEKSSRDHIQFCFKLKEKMCIDDLRHILKCHLDIAKDFRKCIRYCTKDKTLSGKRITHKFKDLGEIIKFLEEKCDPDQFYESLYYNLR